MPSDEISTSALRQLLARRELDAALAMARQLLLAAPGDRDVLFLLGVAQAERGQAAEAVASLRAALANDAHAPWTMRLVLVNALKDAGDPSGAEHEARRILADGPAQPPVLNALGLTLLEGGRTDEAFVAFRDARALNPAYLPACLNEASVLQQRGSPSDALAVLDATSAHVPASARLSLARAKLLEQLGRDDDAIAAYRDAARLDPHLAGEAHRRLGRLHYARNDIYTAIDAYEVAVENLAPDVELWNVLGNACMDVARVAEAARSYRAALAIRPGYTEIRDNLLVLLHYDPTITPERMFEAHREWAALHAPESLPARRAVAASRTPGGVLRVGFLSQSLCRGATGFFLLPLLRLLDRRRFHVVLYSAGGQDDDVASELRAHAAEWRDASAMPDAQLGQTIRADALDIVIDLSGHTPGSRLRALTTRPAPVTITWLDYFDTTGVDAVDYLIADSVSVPPHARQRFTETVLRIDPARLCYAAPAYAPQPLAPPSLRNGYVTFGSFNRIAKLADPVIALWARLLGAVPDARLLLKSPAFNHPTTRRRFARRFEACGVEAERLILRGSSTHAQMLAEYADMDLALDPFPYNGGLTTCEALWMGVPVIALLGDSMISRQSAALLSAAGLPEWVAATMEDWIAIAARLAEDPAGLAAIRRDLRSRIAHSPLASAQAFTRRFEQILLQVAR
jgi:predicted O-linked N-acetylglucosamine transferase (SPINDLY family)